MIDFEIEESVLKQLGMYHMVAEQMMRPISREYDEREHEKPWPILRGDVDRFGKAFRPR